MRFAEKMLLNAKFYGLVAGARHDGFGNRCALGLVEGPVVQHGPFGLVDQIAEELFPWLITVAPAPPCNCAMRTWPLPAMTVYIAHVFNLHVMVDKTWTLERLADWIDSVDPTPRTPEVEAVESIAIRDGQMVCG